MGRSSSPKLSGDVAAVFAGYPPKLRRKLMELRRLIFETANQTAGVGELTETLKWGEPAYLTERTRSGSTIRLGVRKNLPDTYGMFFICSTNLVGDFRREFEGHFSFEGNREIRFRADEVIAIDELRQCIARALTYHLK